MASEKFILKGTTDMAIIEKAYIEDANYTAGLLVGIEERKQIEEKDNMQVILELISASLSSYCPVRFFWLQRGIVASRIFDFFYGVALLENIVRETRADPLPASPDRPYTEENVAPPKESSENVALPKESSEKVAPLKESSENVAPPKELSEKLESEEEQPLSRRRNMNAMSILPERDVDFASFIPETE
ncbi:hypothetical protein BC937DRAFT_89226 [Endogone sp. FLAS-F59071]|nr:hypothetical protein BC937DRAFT_89226 [Endogone sp. FLAS-F59071]|eukprot:RUS22435.1 hypothetical protein BC937DRAFT_89226 [Endogone sp. FLAS-F59071]